MTSSEPLSEGTLSQAEAPAAVAVLAAGHLHPGTLFLNFVLGLRSMIPLGVVALLAQSPVFLVIAVGFFLLQMAHGVARYLTFKYRLTEEELVTTQGILHRQERRIPVNRIQDLSFESTILRRMFGLVVVSVETASGRGAEAKLDSLSRLDAARLREALHLVRSRLHGEDIELASQTVAATPEHLLFAATAGELTLLGLTNNRIGAILLAIAALFEFADDFGLGGVVGGAFGNLIEWLGGVSPPMIAVVLAAVLFMVLMAGWAISVVASLVMFHGFCLVLRGDVLQRRYGLLTTRAASLPRRKVQRVLLEQSLLRRLLRLVVVKADSAGSGMNEKEEVKTGRDIIVPLTGLERGEALVPVLLPGLEPWRMNWRRVSPRVVIRIFMKGVLLTAALLGLGLPTIGLASLASLAVLPAAWMIGFLSFQNLAYSRVEGHVGMRWGIIGRYRSLVPYAKVQAVALRAGPIERILGLATLTVYVAGGSPTVMANLPRDEAAELQRDLAVEAAAAKFVW